MKCINTFYFLVKYKTRLIFFTQNFKFILIFYVFFIILLLCVYIKNNISKNMFFCFLFFFEKNTLTFCFFSLNSNIISSVKPLWVPHDVGRVIANKNKKIKNAELFFEYLLWVVVSLFSYRGKHPLTFRIYEPFKRYLPDFTWPTLIYHKI